MAKNCSMRQFTNPADFATNLTCFSIQPEVINLHVQTWPIFDKHINVVHLNRKNLTKKTITKVSKKKLKPNCWVSRSVKAPFFSSEKSLIIIIIIIANPPHPVSASVDDSQTGKGQPRAVSGSSETWTGKIKGRDIPLATPPSLWRKRRERARAFSLSLPLLAVTDPSCAAGAFASWEKNHDCSDLWVLIYVWNSCFWT